ncbi:Gx transporter family protein, partial [Oribacterium sinus]
MEDREKKTSIRENDISKKVPLGAKRRSSIHLSIYAMFLAISMILGYVEAQLPTPIPIPGVKLGLANLVNILMLFSVGPFPTAVIGFLRI